MSNTLKIFFIVLAVVFGAALLLAGGFLLAVIILDGLLIWKDVSRSVQRIILITVIPPMEEVPA